uniref:Uncharacterized protein n=1 Tax=Anopheles atroparvus TaxID=41427 RepID=A0AAG5DL70_ANOAO
MAESSNQYDAALGGNVELPKEVDFAAFTEWRKEEICHMMQNMASTTHQRKLMHQSLPLHMRRRAMSYDSRRLPRRFRTVHLAQFSKSGVSEKKKRPSRKFRRKPHNLLQEYERRKRAFVWLETHVWHAKRFHMVPRWGYKIALRPCQKGYRSSYRATSRHCLLHDVSYEGCVEVRGDEKTLQDGLRRLCSEKVGLTMAAKAFTKGNRASYVWLYEDGAYPYRCLGRAQFVWRAGGAKDNSRQRTVWIFAHPCFYRKLVEQLVQVFQLKNALRETNASLEDITRNPAEIRFPRYTSGTGTVEVVELKDTLNRFHLTGPLTQAVIAKALRVYKPPGHVDTAYWEVTKDLTSPGELSPGEVIALLVEDPRINRPKKRTKALPTTVPARYNFTSVEQEVSTRGPLTSVSPLWCETVRKRVTGEMQTMHQLNQLRTVETLVPGEPCASERFLQPVPILLLQSPGSQDADYKRLGYGSGWDVIVPAGYGLPVWQSLVLWGAKVAGQLELDMIALESGYDRRYVPDTELGCAEARIASEQNLTRYFNRPHNKRVNYTKLAIASPFRCPWSQLVHEWSSKRATEGNNSVSPDEGQLFVLRDQEALAKLRLALVRKFNVHSIGLPAQALVPLLLTLKTRGNPGDNALICLPKREDFRANKTNRSTEQHGPVYTEPLRTDPHAPERKALRAQHLRTLKRLRGRRVRDKKRRQRANPGVLVRIAKPTTGTLVKEQLQRMADLWVPARPATVRNQCTRECFGYVTQGGFSLSEGKVTGLGYVTARGLEKLFKICTKGTLKVLVRGTRSRGYRFASIRLAQ